MSNDAESINENTWPSVSLAYQYVKDSYSLMQSRVDAANDRIQTTIGFAATITIAAPILLASIVENLNTRSFWAVLALATFIVLATIGTYGRIGGAGIVNVSPKILYDKWLHFTEWEFQKNALFWAGSHFDKNLDFVNFKDKVSVGVGLLFLLEVFWITIWLAVSI